MVGDGFLVEEQASSDQGPANPGIDSSSRFVLDSLGNQSVGIQIEFGNEASGKPGAFVLVLT